MIQIKKSVLELVENAKSKINNLSVENAIQMHSDKNNLFIDAFGLRFYRM